MNTLTNTGIRFYEGANTVFQRERVVIDNSKTEVYKRLCWRFPDRKINESDIKYNGFEKNGVHNASSSQGYCVEFNYEGDEYRLYTMEGKIFESPQLAIKERYEEHILIMALSQLFRVVGERFLRSDLTIDFFNKYQSYEGETHYIFEILYKGTMYPLCFNNHCEPRQREF